MHFHRALTVLVVACVLFGSVPRAAVQAGAEGFVPGADGVRLFYRKGGAADPVAIVLHGDRAPT